MTGLNINHLKGLKRQKTLGAAVSVDPNMFLPYLPEECSSPDPFIKAPSGLYVSWPGMYSGLDIDAHLARRGPDQYLLRFPPPPNTHPDLLTAQAEWLQKDIQVRNDFLSRGGVDNPIGSAYQPWQEGNGPETHRYAFIGHRIYGRYIPLGPWTIPTNLLFKKFTEIRNGKYQIWWGIDRFNMCGASFGFSTQETPPPPGQEGGPFRTQNNLMWASLSLFMVDGNGFPIQIYDPRDQRWREYYLFDKRTRTPIPPSESRDRTDHMPIFVFKVGEQDQPILAGEDNFGPVPVTELPDSVAKQALESTGLFKEKTQYIQVGDEPNVLAKGVVDLRAMIAPEDYSALKNFLKMMPRQILRDWFLKKVWPDLPEEYLGYLPGQGMYEEAVYGGGRWEKKKYEDLVWAAFIDVFNEANLEYINEQQIDPWTWEAEKLESYMVSQDKDAIKDLENQINEFLNVGLALDPKAKVIMEEFALLPKLGDTGLEINRQNAVKQLLKMKDYESAQAIVTAFRYLDESEFGPSLKQPVPFDIVAEDGTTIKASDG